MERYLAEVIKYAKIAYATGKKMIVVPIKREGLRDWKIYLQSLVVNGKDIVDEEDLE